MIFPLVFMACSADPKSTDDTGALSTDTDSGLADTDASDDTSVRDSAWYLEPPDTFLGDVGYEFVSLSVDGWFGFWPRACAVTASGRTFCWTARGNCVQPDAAFRAAAVSMEGRTHDACYTARADGSLHCWDQTTGEISYVHPGPYIEISGACGILETGELACWDRVDAACPSTPLPVGPIVSLDARWLGLAVNTNGALAYFGECERWEGDYAKCLECSEPLWVEAELSAISVDFPQTGCGVGLDGTVSCLNGEVFLDDRTYVDVATRLYASDWNYDSSGCALGVDGRITCFGNLDGVTSPSVFTSLVDGYEAGFYGITPEGTIERIYGDDEWHACSPGG